MSLTSLKKYFKFFRKMAKFMLYVSEIQELIQDFF